MKPYLIALDGLLGILVGEQLVPLAACTNPLSHQHTIAPPILNIGVCIAAERK